MPPSSYPPDYITHPKDRLRAAQSSTFAKGIVLLLTADFAIAAVLMAFLAPRQALFILPLLVLLPAVILGALNLVFWDPWARRYPARPQSPDAIVRSMQSFLLGRWFRINNGVHLAADDHHLHLIPFFLLRLGGARTISIPWPSITEVGPPPKLGLGLTRAKLDGRPIAGPEWAMAIARAAGAPSDSPTSNSPDEHPAQP